MCVGVANFPRLSKKGTCSSGTRKQLQPLGEEKIGQFDSNRKATIRNFSRNQGFRTCHISLGDDHLSRASRKADNEATNLRKSVYLRILCSLNPVT